jgi:hypothetical protein
VLAALLLGGTLAACGGGHRVATPPTTVPPAPTTTAPPATAPPGARLAIGTSQGLEVWSQSTGIFTVGPTLRGVTVSHIAWSADGRYLSWQTQPAGGRGGPELWYASLASGLTRHWRPPSAGRAFGPVVVTDRDVFTFGPRILRYAPGQVRAGRVAVPPVPEPAGSPVESWRGGWIVEPVGSPTGQTVQRITTAGVVLPPGLVLDGGTADGPHFDLEAVDLAGDRLAAELGTHGRGCEQAGTAQLWTAVLPLGTVRFSTPPVSSPGVTQRFWAIDVSGPDGSVYASSFACEARGRHAGQVVSTTLWRWRAGDWHRVGGGIVAGDRTGAGPLATLSGNIRVVRHVASVVGSGTVRVGGSVVATGGQAISWAPRQQPSD